MKISLRILCFSCLSVFSASLLAVDEERKIRQAMPGELQTVPSKKFKALVYSNSSGFKHKSIPTGVKALKVMSEKTKLFTADFTVTTEKFTPEGLSSYDLLIFNNCTRVQKAFTKNEQRQAILDFIKQGKAFVGFHAASDGGTPQWKEYTEMIGGCFAGHPWNAGGKWPFIVEDPDHAVNQAFASKEFSFSDEIYQYKDYNRSKLRVLVGLDAIKSGKEGNSPTNDYPVSWVKSYGKGRVFYSNFGHNKASWWMPFLLQHFLDGIRWSLGDLQGSSESLSQPYKI